ncbi:MAG: hypothetical protein Q7J07_08915 [Pelolinea sp.]|nr:hypothetical protein [Pelolinea sp.]
MGSADESSLETLIEYVLEKPKYNQINRGLIESIARTELAKGRKPKETRKAVLSKLHQVGTAYFSQKHEYGRWESTLASLPTDIHSTEVKDFCTDVMRAHYSTDERLPILEDLYQTILSTIQPIPSVLDLACGLNPLALPWMPVEEDVQYTGCDIFADMIEFLNTFGAHFGLQTEFRSCNLLNAHFDQHAKVAFLLKTIPCLEQVEKGFAERLLDAIPADYILISYPISSLSGKLKGMQENYTDQFAQLIAGFDWTYERFEFSTELAFLVKKS